MPPTLPPPDPPALIALGAITHGEDLTLDGLGGSATVPLPAPRGWTITGDPVLHVRYQHSPALDKARSTLTVRVGDAPLATIPLTPETAAFGEFSIPLPPSALGGDDVLVFAVEQHVGNGCEAPFDPALWTRVLATSVVEVPRRVAPLRTELAELPAPLFADDGVGPMTLTLVQDGPREAGSLEAAGWLAYGFGRAAGERGARFAAAEEHVEDARTAALVVGTVGELDGLGDLVDASALTGNQGLVALRPNPADPTLPVLVVTGLTGEGVRNAARAVGRPDRAALLVGAETVVNAVPEVETPPPLSPAPVGGRTRFRLADLGVDDHTVHGVYAAPIRVPLHLEGDAAPRPGGSELLVRYAYAAGLDPRLSTVEVRVNNVGIASATLSDAEGDAAAVLPVHVPAGVIGPSTTLEVVFNLFPSGWEACMPPSDRHLWATLYAETEVEIARDRSAALPDLARLRFRGWPFTAEGPDDAVSVVLPDQPGAEEVAAGMQWLADMGRWSASPASRFTLGTSAGEVAGTHLQVLLTTWGQPHLLYATLEGRGALAARTEGVRLAGGGADPLLAALPGTRYATVEEVHDGGPAGATTLVIRAPEAGALRELTARLGEEETLETLSGTLAILTPEGTIHAVEASPRRVVEQVSPVSWIRMRIQQSGAWLTWLAAPGALAFAAVVRRWAEGRGGRA